MSERELPKDEMWGFDVELNDDVWTFECGDETPAGKDLVVTICNFTDAVRDHRFVEKDKP